MSHTFFQFRNTDFFRMDRNCCTWNSFQRKRSSANLRFTIHNFISCRQLCSLKHTLKCLCFCNCLVIRLCDHLKYRNILDRIFFRQIFLKYQFQCCCCKFVNSKSTGKLVLFHHIDIFFLTDNNSSLRTSKQLITAEAHHVCSFSDGILNRRFISDPIFAKIDQNTASQIFNDRNVMFFRNRNQFINSYCICKSYDSIITCMNFQKRLCLFCNCALIIIIMCLVSRSNFYQCCSTLFHNIRNPEFSTDFNKLTAGYNDFASFCKGT